MRLSWVVATTAALDVLRQTHFNSSHLADLRASSRQLFLHAWNSYRYAGFPADEVRPQTCDGLGPDPDVTHFGRNDVLGNYSVTLVDTIDTLALMNEQALFEQAARDVQSVSFDSNTTVQVFETTIRGIGGLLSAHILASTPHLGHAIPSYDGHMLAQAYDLAQRLLPAFETSTGIPFPRVHLQNGLVPINGEVVSDTCTAAAGSLLLEFALLSRLTGDERLESLAKQAFWAIWNRRSSLGLLGMNIDAKTGQWTESFSGVGASIDSFYEYALKFHVLFDDHEFLEVFEQSKAALDAHASNGWFHNLVSADNGIACATWIDALAAFWPGVLVLDGKINEAVQHYLTYFKLWNVYGGIPERWSFTTGQIELEWYLLRPEFIESTYYLYQATHDPFFLHVGRVILEDLWHINIAPCGFAGVQDLRTGELNNRMESFFLTETAKYLYLLFDVKNPVNHDDTVVFTTEAHPFWYNDNILQYASSSRFSAVEKSINKDAKVPTVAYKRRLFSKTPKVYPVPEEARVCNPLRSPDGVSMVASWGYFYRLDELISFTRPDWLYRRTDIEGLHGFYDAYVLSDAKCLFNTSKRS